MTSGKILLGAIINIKKGSYITKKEANEGPYPVILGGQEPAYYIDKYNHTGRAIVIVICPSIDEQIVIAGILSAYDSLIENNQKQIKLLEEAAQRLYKEWFVDLRFPGYEDTPIVDGVPEGWMWKKCRYSY